MPCTDAVHGGSGIADVRQHYVLMQGEYLRDPEKHGESITAFSVQLFTVPSLARCAACCCPAT